MTVEVIKIHMEVIYQKSNKLSAVKRIIKTLPLKFGSAFCVGAKLLKKIVLNLKKISFDLICLIMTSKSTLNDLH